MKDKCKICINVGYVEKHGFFYTDRCNYCRHKIRFSMFHEKPFEETL